MALCLPCLVEKSALVLHLCRCPGDWARSTHGCPKAKGCKCHRAGAPLPPPSIAPHVSQQTTATYSSEGWFLLRQKDICSDVKEPKLGPQLHQVPPSAMWLCLSLLFCKWGDYGTCPQKIAGGFNEIKQEECSMNDRWLCVVVCLSHGPLLRIW